MKGTIVVQSPSTGPTVSRLPSHVLCAGNIMVVVVVAIAAVVAVRREPRSPSPQPPVERPVEPPGRRSRSKRVQVSQDRRGRAVQEGALCATQEPSRGSRIILGLGGPLDPTDRD
jgi:hypothetical protein